ncbi:MAG: hypothetical protein IKT90_01735 [Clostridia bacterium]|nr:hypothetical protein [Clostridia bacterium]
MKKVAWGMAFYMLSGPIVLLLMMGLTMLPVAGLFGEALYYAYILIPGLASAGGFYLLMRGAEELGYGGNVDWVRKISMVLAAYGLAETVLYVLDLMPNLGVISTILAYAYNLGGFLAVYMMTTSMIQIQMFRRVELFARELQKWFTIWVLSGFVGSLLPSLGMLAALVELAAGAVMVVYFFRAAKNYGDGSGNYRVF